MTESDTEGAQASSFGYWLQRVEKVEEFTGASTGRDIFSSDLERPLLILVLLNKPGGTRRPLRAEMSSIVLRSSMVA